MKNGLKALIVLGSAGLVGIGLNSSGVTGNWKESSNQYKTKMIVEQSNPYLIINSKNPKSRIIYKRVKKLTKSKGQYELLSIQEDLNGNNKFDREETIYENFELLKEKEKRKDKEQESSKTAFA
jgi:hypothetical protein